MRKKINFLRHFSVLIITIIILTLGIFIGNNVEDKRVKYLYTNLQEQDLDYQQILTESNYINYLTNQKKTGTNISCKSLIGAYYTSIEKLDNSRLKLENYINQVNFKEEEYQRIKNHYENLQINYWILANKIKSLCPNSNMYPILYFYSDKEKCPQCEDQGVHLNYVKSKLKDNVLVFSLNVKKEGPIQLLAQQYDIFNKETPIIIINQKSYSFLENSQIFQILCKEGLKNQICTKN